MCSTHDVTFGDIDLSMTNNDLEDIFKVRHDLSNVEMNVLEGFITHMASKTYENRKSYNQEVKRTLKKFKGKIKKFPSKIELNLIYHKMIKSGLVQKNPSLTKFMKRKFCRSGSGELPVTVFTSPSKFDCPQDCHYCPNEVADKVIINPKNGKKKTIKFRVQPRSYLSTEPGCRRAAQDEFHPVRQSYDRIHSLEIMGHIADKVRFIVLGGTYCYYPIEYREWFIASLYYSCNTYNTWKNRRDMLTLEEEMVLNRTSDVRVVGITVETRPDNCSLEDCAHFMKCGITTIQLGIQQLDNSILKGINRQCTIEQIKTGTKRVLDCGLKLDCHYMLDLPGPNRVCRLSPNQDINMINKLLYDPDFAVADQWKLYPTSTTPFTRILKWYQNMKTFFLELGQKISAIKIQSTWRKYMFKKYGCKLFLNNGEQLVDITKKKYLPYAEIDGSYLIDVILYAKTRIGPDVRLNRIIRDIPNCSIVGGNKITNLRQVIQTKMKKEGLVCHCIRCREIQLGEFKEEDVELRIIRKIKADCLEFFISYNDKKQDKLIGLARLRLLNEKSDCLSLLKGKAIIRELHVHGATVRTNTRDLLKPQHSGFGKKLLKKCEEISIEHGYDSLCVTSGEGVIKYYEKRGFHLEEDEFNGTKYHYMVKNLVKDSDCMAFWIFIPSFIFLVISIIILVLFD